MQNPDAFPSALPDSDRDLWVQMTPKQRRVALQRIASFEGWHRGELEIDQALAETGMSKSRFYRLAAEWRATPCLDALGAQRGSGPSGRKVSTSVVEALQAVLPRIVSLNADASVSQIVRMALEAVRLPASEIPGTTVLRRLVEQELRKKDSYAGAANIVFWDMTAINLAQANGRPFILAACIDRGTKALLGTAALEKPEARQGYALVAEDALRRIARDFARLPWSDRLIEVDMTKGTDGDAASRMAEHLQSALQANVQLASSPKRFGRYFREQVGPKIGKLQFTPARTEEGFALTNNRNMMPWRLGEVQAAVDLATTAYNQQISSAFAADAERAPPAEYISLLKFLVDWAGRTSIS